MAVYAIADLHLSLAVNKPMDVFSGWENYVEKIDENFKRLLKDDDVLVIAGDFSWGMNLDEALEDFKFLDKFAGKKILLKGNHDFYFETISKMNNFFKENNLNSISILQNNAYETEEFAICGTRGWVNESNLEVDDKKILKREAIRLELSILQAQKLKKPIKCFLHYPPVYKNAVNKEILDVLIKYNIDNCYYGHIHGGGKKYAIEGNYNKINLKLISADYLNFKPELIK